MFASAMLSCMATKEIFEAVERIRQSQACLASRERAVAEAQISMPNLFTGRAMWLAMKSAVEQVRGGAPKDHDVTLLVGNIAVTKTFFIEPHAFLFHGVNDGGENVWLGLHYSQLVFEVIHRPKNGPARVITGFSPRPPE